MLLILLRSINHFFIRFAKYLLRKHRFFYEFPKINHAGNVDAILLKGIKFIRLRKLSQDGTSLSEEALVQRTPLYLFLDLSKDCTGVIDNLNFSKGFDQLLCLFKFDDSHPPAACFDLSWNTQRLRNWIWCAAMCIEVLNATGQHESKLSQELMEFYLKNQIPKGPCKGGYWVRKDYSPIWGPITSCAPNDSAFIGYHALIPNISDPKVEEAAKRLYNFIQRIYFICDRPPIAYHLERNCWDLNHNIVDEIFVLAFLVSYESLYSIPKNEQASIVFEEKLLSLFISNGHFLTKQLVNGKPINGKRKIVFSRGQAWALEGLLVCLKHTGRHEKLINNIIEGLILSQNKDGSWNYDLSNSHSGACGKGTPIIAYYLYLAYTFFGDKNGLLDASEKAFDWCEKSIKKYGLIVDNSNEGNIIGLKGSKISFLYSNCYHVLHKRLKLIQGH